MRHEYTELYRKPISRTIRNVFLDHNQQDETSTYALQITVIVEVQIFKLENSVMRFGNADDLSSAS